MKIRILTERDVRAVLSMREAIDIQAQAFATLAAGDSIEGLRSFALSKTPPGIAIFNPSFLKGGKGYGIKVVSDFYDNEKKRVPRMTALIALFDGETGAPRTVMEGAHLTDLRTGAGTGLAARYLARKDSRTMAVIGAGRVARNQVEALCQEHSIETIVLATRTPARAADFMRRMAEVGAPVPREISVVQSREIAVRSADIVVAATTAHEPVFDGRHLKPGTFVVAAGAYEATAREVDSETIRRASKRVIDSKADCLADAGDLQIPIAEGILTAADIAGIAELVAGTAKGRERADEITYYKSTGVPIQDLVTAQAVEARAIARGIGTVIDIGGDHD